jgi:hypothetical protein
MEVEKNKNKKSKKLLLIVLIIIAIIVVILLIPKKEREIKVKIKSTLEKVVEKSDLETVNITYNVIAKKCKDDNNCNKSSNDINEFEYVVSCKGQLTAGIDFSKIDIEVDDKNKKVIVFMPEATLTDEPNIISVKFLNGQDIDASELPNARRLCQETAKEKSDKDKKLIPAAKEQSRVVLEQFYKQWIKAYDSSYDVEVK